MHPEQIAFIKAIRTNLKDQALRNIYADWLDEQGQVELADTQRDWKRVSAAIRHLKYCANECGISWKRFLDSCFDHLEDNDWLRIGIDTPACMYNVEEFWQEFEIAFGMAVDEDKKSFFVSCAC